MNLDEGHGERELIVRRQSLESQHALPSRRSDSDVERRLNIRE
jgi:hypothetical protein